MKSPRAVSPRDRPRTWQARMVATTAEWILPRTSGSREHFLDLHTLYTLVEGVPVDRIAIAQEIGGCGVVREGVHDLLGCPSCRGMLGDVEVEDPTPMVGEDDEDEEHTQASNGNGEEVDRNQVLDVVSEERSPGLRRRCAPFADQPRDRALGHVNPELDELPMDSGRAPQRIGGGHLSDEGDELGVDRRAAHGGLAGELGPVLAKTAALPTQDRLGSHEHEGSPPPGPDLGQPNPEEAVRDAQSGPGNRSLVHGELLTQGEVFEGKLAMAAAEDWEDPDQV
jgi:hypothetical protein